VDADRLFLATPDDLEPRLQEGGSEYNVLGIARLLRMLLIDSPSLADKVSRPRNHDVRFTINAREPIWKLFPHEPPPVLWWVGDGFDPERAASVGPKDVAARELLDQLVLLVNEQQITAEHLIRHALYVEGGVHPPRAPKSPQEVALTDSNLVIRGQPGALDSLRAIGRVVLTGLEPLRAEVSKEG
jgi:hypothetical protein